MGAAYNISGARDKTHHEVEVVEKDAAFIRGIGCVVEVSITILSLWSSYGEMNEKCAHRSKCFTPFVPVICICFGTFHFSYDESFTELNLPICHQSLFYVNPICAQIDRMELSMPKEYAFNQSDTLGT